MIKTLSSVEIGLGSMAAIDRMLCQAAERFLYIGTEGYLYDQRYYEG